MKYLNRFLKVFLVFLILAFQLSAPLAASSTEILDNQVHEKSREFYDDDLELEGNLDDDDDLEPDDILDSDDLEPEGSLDNDGLEPEGSLDNDDLEPDDNLGDIDLESEVNPELETFDDMNLESKELLPSNESYVHEMVHADDMLSPVEETEVHLPVEPRSVPAPHSGLVQFVLEPVQSSLPAGVTMAQARAAAFNSGTQVHYLYANATTTSEAMGINGRYGRDALYLGQSGNRYRILIAGFEGYVNLTGRRSTITVPVNGVNRTFDVTMNAVFVPFNNYPNNTNSASVRQVSYYVNHNGELWRYLTNNVTGTGTLSNFLTGPAPSWMASGTKYYSYDGVFFYTNPRNIRVDGSGAVNASNPHFNYFQYLSFRSESSVTAAQLNTAVTSSNVHSINTSNSVMRNQGQAFINAQSQYGVNALLTFAKGMHESAAGTSTIAINNNNIFGLGAYDGDPMGGAHRFNNVAESVNSLADSFLSRGYLWTSDWRYNGPHVGHKGSGINIRYAMDPYWGQKIAGWAFRVDRTRPASSRDINREQIAVRQNTSTVSVQNAAGSTLYTANPLRGRYFPFLVTGTGTNNRLRVLTDPAIVNGAPSRTALYNRNNAIGFIPNSNVWLTGSGSTAIVPPEIEVSAQSARTTADLNLRRGPGTEHTIITTLPNGTSVTILGTNTDGSWSYVRAQGEAGWVSTEFLHKLINTPTTIQAAAHTRLAVTTMSSPFRYGPGTKYDTIRTIPIYTNVEITGSHGNWRRVMVNNQIGWIHSNRLTYRTRYGTITQDTAFRSSANANGAVIRNLPRGFELDIIGVSHDRNWRRVRVGNQTGWISTPHITTRNDSAHTTLSGWLRPGPLASSGQVHFVNNNTPITVLGYSGNWTQARVGNHSGWIATGRVTTN